MKHATVEALGCYLGSNLAGSNLAINFRTVAGAQLFP
jgi:hypothetical protein